MSSVLFCEQSLWTTNRTYHRKWTRCIWSCTWKVSWVKRFKMSTTRTAMTGLSLPWKNLSLVGESKDIFCHQRFELTPPIIPKENQRIKKQCYCVTIIFLCLIKLVFVGHEKVREASTRFTIHSSRFNVKLAPVSRFTIQREGSTRFTIHNSTWS